MIATEKTTLENAMNDDHPIVPPPLLVEEWYNSIPGSSMDWKQQLATQAAQWGADQELEACCEWMRDAPFGLSLNTSAYQLRDARRPKPPSLKEQAYAALDTYIYGEPDPKDKERTYNIIRHALERLKELEAAND